jgi:hypothetical protein
MEQMVISPKPSSLSGISTNRCFIDVILQQLRWDFRLVSVRGALFPSAISHHLELKDTPESIRDLFANVCPVLALCL